MKTTQEISLVTEETQKDNLTPIKEKLGWNQKFGMMVVAMAAAVVNGYVPNYISLYYTDFVGLSVGVVGSILLLTKVTDGLSDILMGMIIDRTNTKLGKARPWILAGGAGAAVSMFLLFNTPQNLSNMQVIIFCTFFYFLVSPFFGTMMSVSSGTLNNLITSESKYRMVLGVFTSYGSLLTTLAVGLIVPLVLSNMGENQATYRIITLFFALVTIVASVVGALLVREDVTERSRGNLIEREPVLDSLKAVIKNKYFLYLAFGTILYNLTATSVAPYYAKYIFGNVGLTALMNLPGLISVFVLPFAIPLVNKFGKRKSIVSGMLLASLGSLIVFFANTNIVVYMIGKIISGLGIVPFFVALIPLTGEICDYALYKSQKPMDGTITSAATMGGKIGLGLAAGVTGLVMSLTGYSGTAGVQTDSAIMGIRALAGIYPAILFALAAVCFYKINLEKENIENIQIELRERGLR